MNAPSINLYRQAEDYFFKAISLKCLNLAEGVHAYMTGVPVADLNFIYVTQRPDTFENILNLGKRFFDKDNMSFVIVIPQELCIPEREDSLNTLGYIQTGRSVSLAIELEGLIIDSTARFDNTVIIKSNDDQLNDWLIPLISAFESTIEISSIYATAHKRALKKNINFRHFSLYKEETPIASITLSLRGAVARIDDVGTLPEFQGRGYATHLLRYVLSEAKRLGARHCFLESSDSGLGVYQKLGFMPLFKNNIYSKKV